MNKEELVKIVSEKANMTQKDAHEIIGTALDVITHALSKNDRVTLVGFGTFVVRERAAREGRNPRTGAVLHIAARKSPVFVPGKLLKERVIAGGRRLAVAGRR
ncbi:MAG: HU family DNA-binding protein [Candidatus Sericytochromatia bacterium]